MENLEIVVSGLNAFEIHDEVAKNHQDGDNAIDQVKVRFSFFRR